MASSEEPETSTQPTPISKISNRYLIFSPSAIAHIRRTHNICGVLIGTIPNLSQQNVFLGVPLELMPEEARVLVKQGVAYIVDDVEEHSKGFMKMSREERLKFLRDMDEQGMDRAREAKRKLEERSRRALREKGLEHRIMDMEGNEAKRSKEAGDGSLESDEVSLFAEVGESTKRASISSSSKGKLDAHYVTPATSYPPLSPSPPSVLSASPLPDVPCSYPLFRYMHSLGYFSMPGLRFGCHYSMYPGDPLRFHSHFLATGMDWDEEFDLLNIVGGGRLGTGVKKAYLIGGEDSKTRKFGEDFGESETAEPVRAFSIEWAGL